MSTWLITGCSRGLGRSLASALLARGENVVVTARDVSAVQDFVDEHPETALAVALDVTDQGQIDAAVAAGTDRFGAIDVLVNNAGYGYRAAVEEGDDADVRTLFEVHFFGTVNTIKAVLPQMRARRSGTIVNISSIGAQMNPPGSGYYSAVKAAVESLTGSLRKEVEPLGITAMVIEPGAFRTDFAGSSLTETTTFIDDYAATAGKRRKANDTVAGTEKGDPDKAAEVIIDVVESGRAPELLVLGSDAVERYTSIVGDHLASVAEWAAVTSATDLDD